MNYTQIAGGYSRTRPITVCVHCAYEELTTDGFLFRQAQASIGHNLLKPWVDLHAYGVANGLRFVTADQLDSLSEIDAVLFSDRPSPDSALANRLLALDVPKYLQLYETEIIKPENWDRAYHAHFDKIFTLLDDWVDQVRYIKSYHALEPRMACDVARLKAGFAERKLCTLIAGAKLTRHPNELYSERLRTIRWMEAHAAADFDLYGVGWPAADFPSYRGRVDDKLATLEKYRFAICYENARNYPGYITEKIFDCMIAGAVPVYWGAPNVATFIPPDCYIDRTRFASEAELYAHLRTMSAQEHGAYLDRIAAFVASPAFHPFSIENFITTLSAHIAKDVKLRRGEAPQVSVCIPSYNYGRFIETAIDSALAQDVADLEVLVFDNCSTDDTAQRLMRYQGHPQVRIMRNTLNIGGRQNWINAFRVAAGKYLTVLSADDCFRAEHLGRMTALMDSRSEIALSYCPCITIDEAGAVVDLALAFGHPAADLCGGRNEVADLLTYDCYITPSAALIRRSSLEALGNPLNVDLHGGLDWDLWIRLAEKFPDFAYFRDPRVCYRRHSTQHTEELLQSAAFLEDHLNILRNALNRDAGLLLAPRASEIASLLWSRYRRTPPQLAAPYHARTVQIEVDLLNLLLQSSDYVAQGSVAWQDLIDLMLEAINDSLAPEKVVEEAGRLVQNGYPQLGAALYRTWITHTSSPLKYAVAFNLAVLMDEQDDQPQALMYFDHAIRWKPDFDQARLGWIRLLLRAGRKDDATSQIMWLLMPENGVQERSPAVFQQAGTLWARDRLAEQQEAI